MRHLLVGSVIPYILGLFLATGVVTGTSAAPKEGPSPEIIRIALCEWHITHRFAQVSVAEAYSRLGHKTEFYELPCRRSLIEANAGRFDGEVARIRGVTKIFENLIQIESPTIAIEGIAFTRGRDLPITTWKDLRGYVIGIVRGELYAEKGTAGLNPTVVDSYDQLLSLVAVGQLDIGIAIRRDFEISENLAKFKDRGLQIIGEPLFSAPLYHLVHRENRRLVTDLHKIFKKMWEGGDTQKIHKKTMKRILQGN